MPRTRPWMTIGTICLAALAADARAHAACDPAGEDAAAVAAARLAIDAACPCAAAPSPKAHRNCAATAIRSRIGAGSLRPTCRREALRHAKLSVCGRPGSVVCCRVGTGGRRRHRVVADAQSCASGPRTAVCVSRWPSVPTGCDASGCVPGPCGDGTLDPGEECDPPNGFSCDPSCRVVCSPPPSTCGNGWLDPGEACEPPGAGGCTPNCQAAPCGPPITGEIAIACVEQPEGRAVQVAAATHGRGYLVAWTGPFRRWYPEILARRFDGDGAPSNPTVRVLTADAACGMLHSHPGAGSDDAASYVAWTTYGRVPGTDTPFEAVEGRRIGAGGDQEEIDRLAEVIPFGMCRSGLSGPTAVADAGGDGVVVTWRGLSGCLGGPMFENPEALVLSFAGGRPPARTAFPLGFPIVPPPAAYSRSGAGVASFGGNVAAVWHAVGLPESSPPFTELPFVAAAWMGTSGYVSPFSLSARTPAVTGRPAVAAGTSSLFVAWAQGADATASGVTQIRGLRFTRGDGRLDPDGGLLLALVPGGVRGSPAVVFDGSVWVVVWLETTGTTHALRGVAVGEDGTVLDAPARLLAADVVLVEPAVASLGDGRVLVVYGRAYGGATAVRGVFVSGQ